MQIKFRWYDKNGLSEKYNDFMWVEKLSKLSMKSYVGEYFQVYVGIERDEKVIGGFFVNRESKKTIKLNINEDGKSL